MIRITIGRLPHRMIKMKQKIACKKIDFVSKKIQISDLKILEMILFAVKFKKKFIIQFLKLNLFLKI